MIEVNETMFTIGGQWFTVTGLPTNTDCRYKALSTNGRTVIHLSEVALETCIEDTNEEKAMQFSLLDI